MKTAALDKPFRFSSAFWGAYILLAIPTLWFAKPWRWDLPVISIVAGVAFLPFAAAIVCYCPVVFVVAVARGGPEERRLARAFGVAVLGVTLFLSASWALYGFQPLPSIVGAAAAFFAVRFLTRASR